MPSWSQSAAAGIARLKSLVWGGALPSSLPDAVEVGWNGISATGLASTDRWTIDVNGDGRAVCWYCHPSAAWNGAVFVLHSGHSINITSSGTAGAGMLEMLEDLLAEGYQVAGFSMPAVAPNESPLDVTMDGVSYSFADHDSMRSAGARGAQQIRYFIEPVIVAINKIKADGPAVPVYMTGISGGGWTTDWCAALDERIERSYPVMGSLPWVERKLASVGDDWEQWQGFPAFSLTGLTYEHLYTAALTAGRRRLWLLGRDDTVFPVSAAAVSRRVNAIAATLATLGDHGTYIDETAVTHEYTANIRGEIIADAAA